MSASTRIAVLVSGNGSNLQAIIDAIAGGAIPGHIAVVVSNRRKAFGLTRARDAGIPTAVLSYKGFSDRPTYDAALADAVAAHTPDLIVLAGFMRILGAPFLDRFPDRIINLHPALPGRFPGTHAIERAYAAAARGEIGHTGIMVHRVVPEVDAGPVLGTARVDIDPTVPLAVLEADMHAAEHRLLVDVVAEECRRLGHAGDPDLAWRVTGEAQEPTDFGIFAVTRHTAAHPLSGDERTFTVMRCADWVNVIALTPDDEVVLVRQYRHGTDRITAEIPGGMVDPGEGFVDAGRRELREETGFTASTWIDLGVVEPNPAIQSNRCGTVLALDATRTHALDLDPGEVIDVALAPLRTVRAMIADGRIAHALVIAAFFRLIEAAGGWRRPAPAVSVTDVDTTSTNGERVGGGGDDDGRRSG